MHIDIAPLQKYKQHKTMLWVLKMPKNVRSTKKEGFFFQKKTY